MEPQIWGKHAWIFLHSITMTYPENPSNEDKKTYKNFFESLDKILPCSVCRTNYRKHIQHLPIDTFLHSQRSLVEWLINIHNQTNIMHNKPTMEYDQVIDNFKKIYKKDTNTNDIINEESNNIRIEGTNNNIYFIIIMILLIIIFILSWKLISI